MLIVLIRQWRSDPKVGRAPSVPHAERASKDLNPTMRHSVKDENGSTVTLLPKKVKRLFILIDPFWKVNFFIVFTVEAEGEESEEVEKIPPPPGVTVRDVELFKKVQQTTAEV